LYDRIFILLFLVDVTLRLIWLDRPQGSLIFDEWYYVNVARVILGLPQSTGANGLPPYVNAPPRIDPNKEHPPLAKLIIALSMYLLGDNGFGWRIPSVIFGSVAVIVFYLLMKRIAPFKIVPILATGLFSFDNLLFVQSRIAILDIFTLTFMLLGFYWYFSGRRYLSAVGMALSTLTKMTGAAGVLVIVAVQIARMLSRGGRQIAWDQLFSWSFKYIVAYGVVFVGLLSVLDRLWGGYSWAGPHLEYIMSYSGALTSTCPNGIISCPWQWLINQVEIPYLVVNVQVSRGDVTTSYASVQFMGKMNPAILYLTIPAIAYSAYNYYTKRDEFSLFVVAWFAMTYLPFYPAVLIGDRVTYLFYFMMTVPAVCASVAYMIADQKPPRLVVLVYLAVVLIVFANMFPFKVIPT